MPRARPGNGTSGGAQEALGDTFDGGGGLLQSFLEGVQGGHRFLQVLGDELLVHVSPNSASRRRHSRIRSSAKMPAPVAAVIAKLHPKGRIQEVKRETRPGGRVVYAVEILIGNQQYDVEATEDGTVLRNEAE